MFFPSKGKIRNNFYCGEIREVVFWKDRDNAHCLGGAFLQESLANVKDDIKGLLDFFFFF